MKKMKLLSAAAIALLLGGGILWAADHIDAPLVTGQSTDITDMYVFQGTNTANMVFVCDVQGLLTPGATAAAHFDENTLIEFNIDNTGDNVEDLVIQCAFKDGKMYVYGPVKPATTGLSSTIMGTASVSVGITPYSSSTAITATSSTGITAFAGPRDDPFFFDLDQYKKIIAGTATGFTNAPVDKFAGTNVLSAVVEVPKALLNSSIVTGKINVWVETKKRG